MTVKNRIAANPPTTDLTNMPLLLDEFQAAHYIGVSVSFLRKSRSDGEKDPAKILTGNRSVYENPAPPFIRLNKQTVRYSKVDLHLWINNLKRRVVN